MDQKKSSLPLLLRYVRPWTLLIGALFYAFGIGIVKYLGQPILWERVWLGLGMVVMLLLSSYLLNAHFELLEALSPLRKMQRDPEKEDHQVIERIPRQGLLMLSITTMTAGAVLTVIMVTEGAINLPTLIILGVSFLLAFFYAVPPIRLIYTGYGELAEAVLITSMIPAFAFLTQTGEMHRFLLIFSFPFIAFYVAMRIALSFQRFGRDVKLGQRTLLVVLGYQKSTTLHNLLLATGYLTLVIGGIMGLPWALTWPGLLTIPICFFQTWQLIQIGIGAKPAWRVLRLTASSLLALTVYLILLALLTG